jgi:hypothetical protein
MKKPKKDPGAAKAPKAAGNGSQRPKSRAAGNGSQRPK